MAAPSVQRPATPYPVWVSPGTEFRCSDASHTLPSFPLGVLGAPWRLGGEERSGRLAPGAEVGEAEAVVVAGGAAGAGVAPAARQAAAAQDSPAAGGAAIAVDGARGGEGGRVA